MLPEIQDDVVVLGQTFIDRCHRIVGRANFDFFGDEFRRSFFDKAIKFPAMLVQTLDWNLQYVSKLFYEDLDFGRHARTNHIGRIQNFDERSVLFDRRAKEAVGFRVPIHFLHASFQAQSTDRTNTNLHRHAFLYQGNA